MASLDDPIHPLSRRWIAWRLVQLAHRIYDADFYERVTVTDVSGAVAEIEVASSMYGHGVMSTVGPRAAAYFDIEWVEFEPEWIND